MPILFPRVLCSIIVLSALTACAQSTSEKIPATIVDIQWHLTGINGAAPVLAEDAVAPTLQLSSSDARAQGSGGCNRYSGTYTLDGDALAFGLMMQTKMACADAVNQLEQQFQLALSKVATQRSVDGALELLDGGGNVVMALQK